MYIIGDKRSVYICREPLGSYQKSQVFQTRKSSTHSILCVRANIEVQFNWLIALEPAQVLE